MSGTGDQLWLDASNGALTDAVDLLNPEGFVTARGGFVLDPYDPENPPTPSNRRGLTISGTILGGSAGNRRGDVVLAIKDAIQRKLWQAALSLGNGDDWQTQPVCVMENLLDASNFTRWDVVSGVLEQGELGFGWMDVTLKLRILPMGRGPRKTAAITTVSSLYHTFYIPNIAGDVPAIPTLTIADTSGGGRCLNDIRVAVASTPDLIATDLSPVIEAVPAYPTVQIVSVGAASAGSITLSFGGQTTGSIAYNASAATVQTALTGLSSIGTGGVTVNGSGTTALPWVITFAGTLATAAQALITGVATGLTGGTLSIRMLTGTSLTDASATGGTTVRVGQTDNKQPQAAAFLIGPSSGALQHGRFDPFIRVRENPGVGAVVAAPVLDSVSSGTLGGDGTLDGTTISVCMTSIDASGNETAPCAIQQLAVPNGGNQGVYATFHQTVVPTSTRTYFQVASSAWRYIASAAGALAPTTTTQQISTSTSGVAGSPPTAQAAATYGTQTILSTGLATPNPATGRYVIGRGVGTSLGNSRWEYVQAPTARLSTAVQSETLVERPYQAAIDTITANPNAYTVPSSFDIDHVVWMPHGRLPQLHMWIASLDMATPRTWIADIRRDGAVSVVLTDGSNVQSQASVEGSLALGPGGNILVLIPTKQQRESDLGVSYTLSLDYTPRYLLPVGLVL